MKVKNITKAVLIWGPVSEEGINRLKEDKALAIVPENRPYLIGLKYNACLLKRENINFVYCTDNMLGFLFYKDKIRKTLFFYKERKEKGIVGICGSLYMLLLSKLHNIPIEVISQGEVNFRFLDKDVSSLGGKSFILGETDKSCIIGADDELVNWEVLQ